MKLLKIISIIIIIVALITGVMWLVARKKTTRSDGTPVTFKEFISADTGINAPDDTGGTFGSVFTGETDLGSTEDDSTTSDNDQRDPGTRTSSFTGSSLNPSTSSGGGSTGGSTGGGSSSVDGGSGDPTITPDTPRKIPTTPTLTRVPVGGTTLSSSNGCTPADLNIIFTKEEIDELHALQERFYTIAQSIHTDADTSTQIANYDAFVIKDKAITELLSYCKASEAKLPASPSTLPGTDAFKNKVPTPFWWDPAAVRYNKTLLFNFMTSTSTIVDNGVPLGYIMGSGQIGGKIDSIKDIDVLKRSLERVLRLNLW